MREVAVGVRPHDHVDELLLFEELLAQPLGHAPKHADGEVGPLLDLFRAELGEAAPDAVLRLLANRARVDEDDVGLVLAVRQPEAVLQQ